MDEFEAINPEIDIRYEMEYVNGYMDLLTDHVAKGNIPDFVYIGWPCRKPLANAGQLYDHTAFIDPDYYDLNRIPRAGPNGEIWFIPLGTSKIASVLYMNETVVKDLGFSTPETYEDMVAMVAAARIAGKEVVTIDGEDLWVWGICLFSSIVARLSGDPQWFSKVASGAASFTDRVFIDSLALLRRMWQDGLFSDAVFDRNYTENIDCYNNGSSLFMAQGYWSAGSIGEPLSDSTLLLAWPVLPGENPATAGSVAAIPEDGYGLTKKGASNPRVRDAACKFNRFFNSVLEVDTRLWNGSIMAPILKDYTVPEHYSSIIKRKVEFAYSVMYTESSDVYLPAICLDAFNSGIRAVAAGTRSPEDVAKELEGLLRP